MNYLIYGAGAVGGAIGGLLQKAGRNVTFIARGHHLSMLKKTGLRLRTPASDDLLSVNVVSHPAEATITDETTLILAMKTQDSAQALEALSAVAGVSTPIVCAQNGLESERLALRHFENVYGCLVFVGAAHLEPGVVDLHSWPCPGVLDLGRFPQGIDRNAETIAADLRHAKFDAIAREDIMAWKRRKLLLNLANGVQVITGESFADVAGVTELARREGETCFEARDLPYVEFEVFWNRVKHASDFGKIDGRPFPGSSSRQSLLRGLRKTEIDYLNGEIALQARLANRSAPINAFIQSAVRRLLNGAEGTRGSMLSELKEFLAKDPPDGAA